MAKRGTSTFTSSSTAGAKTADREGRRKYSYLKSSSVCNAKSPVCVKKSVGP